MRQLCGPPAWKIHSRKSEGISVRSLLVLLGCLAPQQGIYIIVVIWCPCTKTGYKSVLCVCICVEVWLALLCGSQCCHVCLCHSRWPICARDRGNCQPAKSLKTWPPILLRHVSEPQSEAWVGPRVHKNPTVVSSMTALSRKPRETFVRVDNHL